MRLARSSVSSVSETGGADDTFMYALTQRPRTMRSNAQMSSVLPLGMGLVTGVMSVVTTATMDCREPSRARVRESFSGSNISAVYIVALLCFQSLRRTFRFDTVGKRIGGAYLQHRLIALRDAVNHNVHNGALR